MSYNYTLQYRTFESLVADAKSDFKKYELEDLIDEQDMIKVARRVNYDLGLRINMTKEIILEVERGRVRLPNNFYTLNFALMCGSYQVQNAVPQGTHVEERIIDPVIPEYQPWTVTIDTCKDPVVITPCEPCNQCGTPCCTDQCNSCISQPESCTLNCKGETVQLVQVISYETRQFDVLRPIRMLENAMDIDCDCPNLYWDSPITAWIKDGWLYTNFKTGKVYLNYQSLMEDDEGNLMVLDHEMINEYYEYALKQRILENLIMNDVPVSNGKIQLIEQRYRNARIYALTIVNTPNYGEMRRMWQKNRKALWSKYYNMFSSYPALGTAAYNGQGLLNNATWRRNQ
jgi:hypothetical protein